MRLQPRPTYPTQPTHLRSPVAAGPPQGDLTCSVGGLGAARPWGRPARKLLRTLALLAIGVLLATRIAADVGPGDVRVGVGPVGGLAPDTAAVLDRLGLAPERAGALIYQGTVHAQDSRSARDSARDHARDHATDSDTGSAPGSASDGRHLPALKPSEEQPALFTYQRRVVQTPNGLLAHHLTRDPGGALIIDESAQVDASYHLQRFDVINRQQGFAGSVQASADGQQLTYRLVRNGKTETTTEALAAPAVTGPSLHGFVLQHWDSLAAGQSISVRMVVLTALQSYGFDIRQASQREGQTTFLISPSHWLIRLAVAPLTVVFDSHTKALLRYQGRVPPQQQVGGQLRDLDARVDYQMHAAFYR